MYLEVSISKLSFRVHKLHSVKHIWAQIDAILRSRG